MIADPMKNLFCILLLLQMGALFGEGAEKPVISVYLPDYRVKVGDLKPRLYGTTHLVLFSAKPTEEGAVDFCRITPELLAFGRKARDTGDVKVTFCVGGWGRGNAFAGAVSTAENRNRFVDALVEFCESKQLDGIDIDWEFPKGNQEHADFALFLEALSGKLRSVNCILTVALGESRPLPEKCWPFIDQVNLMSYQPWWSKTDYDTYLSDSIELFLKSGLPPEKLILGVGFFAKEKAGKRRAVSWKKLVGENAVSLPESEHGFWPVGPEACDLRLKLIKEHGLGGVMVWDYGHDSFEPEHSLLRHLSAGLAE